MKRNANKCYLLVSKNANVTIKTDKFDINNADCKKFLKVKFDQRLTFYDHILDLCK